MKHLSRFLLAVRDVLQLTFHVDFALPVETYKPNPIQLSSMAASSVVPPNKTLEQTSAADAAHL